MTDKQARVAKLHAHEMKLSGPTQAQLIASGDLCDLLPSLLSKAAEAGMPRTARALAEAVKAVGWERAELLTWERANR